MSKELNDMFLDRVSKFLREKQDFSVFESRLGNLEAYAHITPGAGRVLVFKVKFNCNKTTQDEIGR